MTVLGEDFALVLNLEDNNLAQSSLSCSTELCTLLKGHEEFIKNVYIILDFINLPICEQRLTSAKSAPEFLLELEDLIAKSLLAMRTKDGNHGVSKE